MKAIALIVVIACGGLLILVSGDFPTWGDPTTPAAMHVSPHYIENAVRDTSVPNLVTAVLADYRGYDTMLETTVIFIAGVVCFFLLRKYKTVDKTRDQYYRHKSTNIVLKIKAGGKLPENSDRFEKIDSTWVPYDLVIKTTCRILVPFIQLFALYVIAHGHHSPGGGFQGGVILGASFILFAISFDLKQAKARFRERTSSLFSAVGVLIYAGTGALCILTGSNFLDYGKLAPIFATDPVSSRSLGILLVEIGVGLSVMAVMVWIYYNISSQGEHEEGL